MEETQLTNKESQLKARIAGCFKNHFTYFGYKKTSVDEVARELKISKKTIYKYFPTKRKVFNVVVSKIARVYTEALLKKVESYNNYSNKILALISIIFKESPKWIKKDVPLDLKFKIEIAGLAFTEAYKTLLEYLVHMGIESGEFSIKNSPITILFLQTIIAESTNLIGSYDISELKIETTRIIKNMLQT